MTNTQTAIKSAEKRLNDDIQTKLQNEIYDFLKQELESIDSLDAQIRRLNEEKRIHEENIKNVKSGNLEAIEKRKKALNATWDTITISPFNTSNPYWYNDNIAGFTYTSTITGKTYIF